MRTNLVAGNWKMHGSLSANSALLAALVSGIDRAAAAQCAVCVPAPYLAQAQASLAGTPIGWGAQNVSEHAQGAYTGECSVAMLRDFGCGYAIVGHSERRALYAETDLLVAAKVAAVLAGGLTPICCVGETLAEREAGQTQSVVSRQLAAVLDRVGIGAFASIVVAYEPVWAIGTGRTATPEQAQEVHAAIRAQLVLADAVIADGVRILYGGSVKASNAKDIFRMPDVDGGLIGGASLVAGDFLAIHAAACGTKV
jgi:triosephosphate isomerase